MDITTRSADMAKHWDLILKLRHSYNSPDLDDDIKRLADTRVDSNRFLIKMEIMRLSHDVRRVIDLRSIFKSQCEPIEHGGITHFMDEQSIKDFEKEIEAYDGRYTLGVYEQIMSNAKYRHKHNNVSSLAFKVPKPDVSPIAKFHQREEERLYFTKKVTCYFRDPESMKPQVKQSFAIDATTTDLSFSGLSIKIPTDRVARVTGDVYVHMSEIESEFHFQNSLIVGYEILNHNVRGDSTYLSLKRKADLKPKASEEFGLFTKHYIKTYKRRNRVPVGNTEQAVSVKLNEQFIITRMSSLPVFLNKQNDLWLPRATFLTENNYELGLHTSSGSNHDFLTAMFRMPYLQEKLSIGERFKEHVFFFPIVDKHGKSHYLTIPYDVVACNKQLRLHARKAIRSEKLSMYRLDGTTINPETDSHVPTSLPSDLGETFENMNRTPIARAQKLANELQRMVVISDITDSLFSLNLLDEQDDSSVPSNGGFKIQDFIMRKLRKTPEIYETRAETSDFRAEDRFAHSMKIELQKIEDKSRTFVSGTTENISTKGMKVILDEPINLKAGDEILVNLTGLPKPIRNQPYKIVGRDSSTIYRLVIIGNSVNHEGRKEMRKYIYKTMNDLKPMGVDNEIYGLSRVLRNLYSNNIPTMHGLTCKQGSMRYVRTLIADQATEIPTIVKEEDSLEHMLELIHHEGFRGKVVRELDTINKSNPYETLHLLVMPKKKSSGEFNYIVRSVDDVTDEVKFSNLIASLQTIGSPKVLRVKLTKKGRVFNKYIKDEMNYLTKYAQPKSQELSEVIKHTTGVFEITDITDLAIPGQREEDKTSGPKYAEHA